MQGAPLYLPADRIATRGSAEALENVFWSESAPDSIAAWYRWMLDRQGWQIVGDARMPDGSVTIHAERDGPPFWVIIRPHPTGSGTEFSVIGALRDSAAPEP
jgi:hypothetical protein